MPSGGQICEGIANDVLKLYPHIKHKIDTPMQEHQTYFLDFWNGNHIIVVTYKKGMPFGVSAWTEGEENADLFSNQPDETYEKTKEVFNRIVELVSGRLSTSLQV